MAPNGNGGCYMSLRDAGLLRKLEAEGVTSVFQFGVDNVLCHVADPTFLGFCHSQKAECAALTAPGTTRTQQRDEGTGWPSTETTSR